MENKENRGISRLIRAFWYSIDGLKAAWKNEEAFRLEIIAALLVIPAGLWLGTTATQRALLIGIYLIILITELINSAIEAIVDRMGPERHVLSGRAKDLGSAAVFVSIFAGVVVWGIIAYERVFA
ncbi:MAG: diacylglycerol kinase [Deltaproteobacteria bacterium]|nr:diacylglycerol kinase [Deltaproteobacteria bacterium]